MTVQNLSDFVDILVCPETKLKLNLCTLAEAETKMRGRLAALRGSSRGFKDMSPPFGVTPYVLLREDLRCAYPVVDGVPILMVPEILGTQDQQRSFDLQDPKYAEAYQEMEFYNELATQQAKDIRNGKTYGRIEPALKVTRNQITSFPNPKEIWLSDAKYECAAQWDAYKYIAPLRGKRVLQLGGEGTHAVKFLLGGAAEAWAVTPMLGEARCAYALAQAVGVDDCLRCIVAIGEELPFESESFDVVFSGSCVHHLVTAIALPEIARILGRDGKFAATDPWRAPLYSIGTKVLGKREPVFCRPLTRKRVEPLRHAFDESRIIQHGTLTRYPLLALKKLGISTEFSTIWQLYKIDDAICSLIPGFRRMGSSTALLGTKMGF